MAAGVLAVQPSEGVEAGFVPAEPALSALECFAFEGGIEGWGRARWLGEQAARVSRYPTQPRIPLPDSWAGGVPPPSAAGWAFGAGRAVRSRG
jgi:hypothetical protein